MRQAKEHPVGKRFGDWTVLSLVRRPGQQTLWRCVCVCGNERDRQPGSIRGGYSQSCGCSADERRKIAATTHGLTGTSVCSRWHTLRKRYGIDSFCKRWQRLETFAADLAAMEHTGHYARLQRIDPSKPWGPTNVRWVGLSMNGETATAAEWARRLGISRQAMHQRLKHGWTVEEATMLLAGVTSARGRS